MSAPPARVALGLGANLGDPRRQLLAAVAALSRRLGALAVAPLFRSSPVSPLPQPDFLNTVVVGRTDLAPEQLLRLGKELEAAAGRRAGPRHGPRPLDVDLLLYDERLVAAADLTVPHPRLAERSFALAPLARLAPDWQVPPHGRSVGELLAALATPSGLRQVGWNADADR